MSTSASDRAYDWLHSAILAGEIPSGTFIDEASVCEATGVSRTPVREAFHRLAGERFLQLVPRRGVQVRDLSARDVLDAYRARWMIESTAVRAAFDAGTVVSDRMRPVLDAMEAIPSEDVADPPAHYIELDKAFHRVYVEAMDNKLVAQFYDTLWPLHEWNVFRRRSNSSDFIATVNAEHRQIYEAFVADDSARVLDVLYHHLRPFPF